jgi:iron-sulfur cluster repair protein YtfE (RIC family)
LHTELFTLLRTDHEQVLAIVTRLQESGDAKIRKDLLDDLLQAILSHMVAEEQVIYPALGADAAAWANAREGIEEHHEAQAVLQKLVEQSAGTAAFLDQLEELRAIVEEHIRFEEEAIFADLKRVLSEHHAGQSLDSFLREKDLARQRYPDLPTVTADIGQIRT